jgi:hypothetical protein
MTKKFKLKIKEAKVLCGLQKWHIGSGSQKVAVG